MQNIAKLLALTHPETEAFSSMALDQVVRLVKSGHDDDDVAGYKTLELGLTVFILFYLNEQVAELQGDGV